MPYLSRSQKIYALINAWHGFMRPDIRSDGAILLVGTMNGTEVIGCDNLLGEDPPPSDCPEDDANKWTAKVAEYCSAGIVDPDSCFETVSGFIVRMSAPGYMDATDWTYCVNEADVLRWLENEAEELGSFELPYCDDAEMKSRREWVRMHSHVATPVILRDGSSHGSYGAWEHVKADDKQYMHVMISLATGSDYSGCSVTRSNFNILEEWEAGEYSDDIITVSGGHGTYGAIVRMDCVPALWEIIQGLADYPSIDDEAISETKMEWRDEALGEFMSDTESALWHAFPDDGECLDASETLAESVRKIITEYCNGPDVEWHYQNSDAWADSDKASRAILKLPAMRTIVDDCYCDALPSVPESSACVRYVVEDASGTIVEESHTGNVDHDMIIRWVHFAYSPLHHVRIYNVGGSHATI